MPAPSSTRERLVAAAFRLFAEQGYDATTIDQIAAAAEVGRTTFFRHFPTKEGVVFPDHLPMHAAISARLGSASMATAEIALFEAAAIVLDHYLDEREVARERYRLTRTIPALRSAEIAQQRDYQQIFRDHARTWGMDDLDAELVASAVVTAHNYVLRRWLRGLTEDPRADLATALTRVRWGGGGDDGAQTQIVVLRTRQDIEPVVAALRETLARSEP